MRIARNYKYVWSLLPGIITFCGLQMGGLWTWSNFLFSLVVLAILEVLMPEDKENRHDESDLVPDMILLLHVIVQIGVFSVLFTSIYNDRLQGLALAGAILSVGIHSGSSSIVAAHEMIHRKSAFWQVLGKFLLLTAGNMYFYVQHLRVHHKWVGTPRDPATARYGESVYRFFFRSTLEQILNSAVVERERLNKLNLSAFHYRNYILTSLLLLFTVSLALYYFIGAVAVLVFLGQAVLANFLLEYINYIEHYGLTRDEGQRVNVSHSWQTDKVISRFLLLDLSRHSDHHYYASKPYHTLLSYKESPELPCGYASGIYLALIPPLWFKIVHQRLESFHQSASKDSLENQHA